jgi:biopolymer transport protein TolQ
MLIQIWELVQPDRPLTFAVFLLLLAASIFSWSVAFSKLGRFRRLRSSNLGFLRAFRKANAFDQLALASEQFRGAPLVTVFDYGYAELDRQMKSKGTVFNKTSLERSLQLGISEEVGKLEQNLNWLATVATVTPFIGLFGTVWGIIDAFQALSAAGSASLRVVGPGIADALVATALGLAAAVPAAIFYNWFGAQVKEMGARMEDFGLEFMNLVERAFER